MKEEILKILTDNHIKYKVHNDYLKINCLYHDERTPSLFLYLATSSFYCFGCNKFGTMADLISKITGMLPSEAKNKYNLKSEVDRPIADQNVSKQINLYLSRKIHDVFTKMGPTKELVSYITKLDDLLQTKEISMKESKIFIKKMEQMLYNISGK